MQLAIAETGSGHASDEFGRRSVSDMESVVGRRIRQLGSEETRDGNHRKTDHDPTPSHPPIPRVEPETETRWEFGGSPALLHLLDDLRPNLRPLHIADHLRHRARGDRPLQKGGNGKTRMTSLIQCVKVKPINTSIAIKQMGAKKIPTIIKLSLIMLKKSK